MANVAYARLGKSLRLKRDTIGKFAATGAGEARTLLITLAKLNPQNTYYLIGKSDYAKLGTNERKELFPNGNVIDVWNNFPTYEDVYEDYIIKEMDGIDIDYGVMFGGVLSLSLPNKIRKVRNPEEYAKPMSCYYNYGSPIVNYLNESKIKWVCANTDTRYYPVKTPDLLNPEKAIVGMWNQEFEIERLKSFDSKEMVKHKVKSFYSGIETLFLADDKKVEIDETITRDKFIIFHNQDGVLDKKKIIEEYVLDNGIKAEVYGNWKNVDNEAFKGFLNFDELHKKLQEARYTFIIPINKTPLCSMKTWEALHYGIIPFVHEYYDMDRNLSELGFPEFCRISSPEDLYNKVQLLEKDEDFRDKLLSTLKTMLKEEYYTGEHLNKQINKALELI